MVRRTTVGVVAAAVFAVAGLAGCGSEDNGNQNAGQGGTVASSAPAAPSSSASDSAAPSSGAGGDAAGQDGLQSRLEQLLKASPIKFGPYSAELTDASKSTLKQVAEAAAGVPDAKLKVRSTAASGSGDKSKALSQQRADAVSKELTTNGLAADRVTTEAAGDEGVGGDVNNATTTDITVVK